MKHNALPILAFLSLFSLSAPLIAEPEVVNPTHVQLKCLIEIPAARGKLPRFAVHFAGKQEFSADDGFFTFALPESPKKFSLVISEHILPHYAVKENAPRKERDRGTIAAFSIDAQKPYKYYELDYDKTETMAWHEKEMVRKHVDETTAQLLPEQPELIIPTDAIVILMDPAVVKYVETWHLEASKYFVQGPKIVLDETKMKEIGSASARSLALAPDLGRYFETSLITSALDDKTGIKVTLNC